MYYTHYSRTEKYVTHYCSYNSVKCDINVGCRRYSSVNCDILTQIELC